MKRISLMILFAVILSALPGQARATGDAIGVVQVSEGEVLAYRAGADVKLSRKDEVFGHDILKSGSKSFAQIMFRDGTVLTMGAMSRIVLAELEYERGIKGGLLEFEAVTGTFRFLTGRIAKQSPEDFRIETPLGSIGIRGTEGGVAVHGPVDDGSWWSENMPGETSNQKETSVLVAAFQGNVKKPLVFTDFNNRQVEVGIGSFLNVSGTAGAGESRGMTPGVRSTFEQVGLKTSAKTPKQYKTVFDGYDHSPGRSLNNSLGGGGGNGGCPGANGDAGQGGHP